MMKVSLRP